jgi:hypothetical protein
MIAGVDDHFIASDRYAYSCFAEYVPEFDDELADTFLDIDRG